MAAPGIAVPGTVIPSGVLVTPGGPQGIGGIQGPSGPNAVSAQAGNQAVLGTDNLIYVPASAAFMLKTSAYTATIADSGKEIICSGGSWTLNLPTPAAGLTYDVRNDQGISGTTGTITIQPASGTIDGAASLGLLPQQECKLRCDGTNWRSFEKQRIVVIGTQDIVSAQATGVVLLPVGYRMFELEFTAQRSSVNDAYLCARVSQDGGATFPTTGYWSSVISNTSATAVANQNTNNGVQFYIGAYASAGAGNEGQITVKLYPGDASSGCTFVGQTMGYWTASTIMHQQLTTGQYGPLGVVNAFQYYFNTGNIVYSKLTVKGVA